MSEDKVKVTEGEVELEVTTPPSRPSLSSQVKPATNASKKELSVVKWVILGLAIAGIAGIVAAMVLRAC